MTIRVHDGLDAAGDERFCCFLDFIEAENSMGFHADQEAVRILGESIDFSRRGQAALSGMTQTVASPAPERVEAGETKTGAPATKGR